MLITLLLLPITSFKYSIRSKSNIISIRNHDHDRRNLYQDRLLSTKKSPTSLSLSTSSSTSLISSPSEPALPTTMELLGFGLPTLGIWLLQPILSLIDTAVVGMFASSSVITQLAAIGPGIAWIDSSSYLCQFIGIATTNLYAISLSEGDNEKSRKILSHAFFISLIVGALLNILQYAFAPQMVTILSGPNAKECINYALSYARIRSFAAIFAVPSIVAQSAFLASKDAITPLKAVVVGALANLIGDLYFVRGLGMGLQGAAIATTMSQIFGALYLLGEVFYRVASNKYEGREETFISKLKKYISIPSVNDATRFLAFCGPISFILFAKSFLWSFTTYAISTAGTASLAAHQITINIFLFFVIFGDVTSQMSQTFLPAYFMTENSSLSKAEAGSKAAMKIAKLGVVLGSINSIIGFLLQYMGNFIFTSSKPIVAEMLKVPFLLGACILPHAAMTSFEGVVLALRDTKFHVLSYLITGIGFLLFQSYVRFKAGGIFSVWIGFLIFQWTRLIIFSFRSQHLIALKIKDKH